MDPRNLHIVEALEARIVLSTVALGALNAKLAEFAADKTTPPAIPLAPTLLTAKADDVVYAVYQLTLTPAFDDPTEVADLVTTALEAQNGKARADKDKIAPRIFDAALLGSGLDGADDVAQILTSLAGVNKAVSIKTQLSVTGKAALVAQALESTNDANTDAGVEIGNLAVTLSGAAVGATADAKLQTFVISALKGVGTATAQVRSFTDTILDAVVGGHEAFAFKVAEAVAKNPVVAGRVLGGLMDEFEDHDQIVSATVRAIGDPKLAKAISAVVDGSVSSLAVFDPIQFIADVIGQLPPSKTTTQTRAAIASGVIQNVTTDMVGDVIETVLSGKVLTKAEIPTFAGGAAVNTGDLAADLVTTMSGLAESMGANDVTTLTRMGVAVLKGIATTSPASGRLVAQELIAASPSVFPEASYTLLAQNLAKGVPTSAEVAGSAVAGVGSLLNSGDPSSDDLANLAAAVTRVATKSTISIAKALSGELQSISVGDYAEFAKKIVRDPRVTSANAPGVAAGVALTAVLDSLVMDGQITSGETPGDIAAAVAGATETLKGKAATIAGAVAVAVAGQGELESVADIGAKVGALYQPPTSASKFPKFSAIGTLATSLAKAINTSPLATTAERTDELGELTAELTRQAIKVLGPSAPQLPSTIGTIGTAVMKGLSASLLQNGGAFAADLKDAARDIAGAVAQTVSVSVLEGHLTDTQSDALIGAGKIIETSLAKAAKKFAGEVTTALADVRSAEGNSERLVFGTEMVSNENTGGTISAPGKYEIGSRIDLDAHSFILRLV